MFSFLIVAPEKSHPPPRRRRTVFLVCGASLLLLLLGAALWATMEKRPETRWTMLNVSSAIAQADCHLIEFPDGERVLVDAADAIDIPGRAITWLRVHNIDRINLVVISHFHLDHYGRLRDFINGGIRIDRVALNVPMAEVGDRERIFGSGWDTIQTFLKFLRDKNVPYFTPKPGDRLVDASTDGVPIYLDVVSLYDGVHTPIGVTDVNDTSILLRLSHGDTRALFTGDLNHRMGMYLATHNFDLAADILKVPHHGTEGAAPNEFFDRVHPKAALVPSPKALWWSLRSKRIRTYFADHHIPTYVSGINGDVTVTMTTSGFKIKTQR